MTTTPTTYEIRIEGQLDDHWSAWLGDLALSRDDHCTTTTINVTVVDQAQLHGLLARLGDIGATIVEFRATSATTPTCLATFDRAPHTQAPGNGHGEKSCR